MPSTSIHGQDSSGVNRIVRTNSAGEVVLAAQAGDDTTFDVKSVLVKAQSITLSAAGDVKPTPGYLLGFRVLAAATSPTIAFQDGGSGGSYLYGSATNPIAAAAGDEKLFPFALEFGSTIYFELNTGTIEIQVFYV